MSPLSLTAICLALPMLSVTTRASKPPGRIRPPLFLSDGGKGFGPLHWLSRTAVDDSSSSWAKEESFIFGIGITIGRGLTPTAGSFICLFSGGGRLLFHVPPKSCCRVVRASQQGQGCLYGRPVGSLVEVQEWDTPDHLGGGDIGILGMDQGIEFRISRASHLGPCLEPVREDGQPFLCQDLLALLFCIGGELHRYIGQRGGIEISAGSAGKGRAIDVIVDCGHIVDSPGTQ